MLVKGATDDNLPAGMSPAGISVRHNAILESSSLTPEVRSLRKSNPDVISENVPSPPTTTMLNMEKLAETRIPVKSSLYTLLKSLEVQ